MKHAYLIFLASLILFSTAWAGPTDCPTSKIEDAQGGYAAAQFLYQTVLPYITKGTVRAQQPQFFAEVINQNLIYAGYYLPNGNPVYINHDGAFHTSFTYNDQTKKKACFWEVTSGSIDYLQTPNGQVQFFMDSPVQFSNVIVKYISGY